MPQQQSCAFALPPVLNASRTEDLRALWGKLRLAEATEVDGSGVTTLDSAGLQLLVEGLDALERQNFPVTILNPSAAIKAARRSFRMGDRVRVAPVPEEDAGPVHGLGMRLGELLVANGTITAEALQQAVGLHEERPEVYIGQILIERACCRRRTWGAR